jgi:ribonuclease Z
MKSEKRIDGSAMVVRLLVMLIGLFFLALGIGFMVFPDVFAQLSSVSSAYGSGVNALRGDLGGLFLGMSFFCLLGAATFRRRWLVVPIVFIVLIVAGRLIGLALGNTSSTVTQSLTIEVVLLVLLTVSLAVLSNKRGVNEAGFRMRELLNLKILVGVVVVAAIFACLLLSQKRIGMALVKRVALNAVSTDVITDLPDGLHVALCGSGSPLTDARRASPCVAVIAGGNLYVVDVGPGSMRNFDLMRLNPGRIKAVLLTHFHSDHIGALGELMLRRWVGGASQSPLDVFGPTGVEKVVNGFNLAYSLDSEYRVSHHGPETVPPSGFGGAARPFSFQPGEDHAVIINDAGLKVTAFLGDHDPAKPAVGYRFDYKGRSAVISGDTLPTQALRNLASGIDLLVHSALQPAIVRVMHDLFAREGRANMAKILHDIQDYHTSPEDAARIASEAGVKHLLLYHIVPPLPASILKSAYVGEAGKNFTGPITIGEDGMLFSLPAENTEILKRWLL